MGTVVETFCSQGDTHVCTYVFTWLDEGPIKKKKTISTGACQCCVTPLPICHFQNCTIGRCRTCSFIYTIPKPPLIINHRPFWEQWLISSQWIKGRISLVSIPHNPCTSSHCAHSANSMELHSRQQRGVCVRLRLRSCISVCMSVGVMKQGMSLTWSLSEGVSLG